MDSSETADALNSAVQRIVTPGDSSTSQPVNDELDDEHTPLLAAQNAEAGGVYSTPRELLESSLYSSRSWRNTSSYIARVSYYSRLNGSARTNTFNVPPHIMAQYLVIPSATGYQASVRNAWTSKFETIETWADSIDYIFRTLIYSKVADRVRS